MKVLTPGHRYELAYHDPSDHVTVQRGAPPQVLQFIHKEPVSPAIKAMKTIEPGTTNEEVLAVLIDRLEFLQERMPCDENVEALGHLSAAMAVLNCRTNRRQAAGIEGQHKEEEKPQQEETEATPSPTEANNGQEPATLS